MYEKGNKWTKGRMREGLTEILLIPIVPQSPGHALALWKREMGSLVGIDTFPGSLSHSCPIRISYM